MASVIAVSEADERSYSINYFSCTTPDHVRKYDRSKLCSYSSQNIEVQQQKTYSVLQLPTSRRIQGHRCRIKVSEYHFKCGAWGHLKLQTVPRILHNREVTQEACQRMVTHHEYTVNGYPEPIRIKLNTPTYAPITVRGELKENNQAVSCVGEEVRIGKILHENVVALAEYKILLTSEEFIESNGAMESVTDHLSLPCHFTASGCVTGEATYVWNRRQNFCPLQLVKNIHPRRTMSTYLVDHDEQILLNTTGSTRMQNCEFGMRATDHDNLFIAETSKIPALPVVDPKEVDVALQASVHLNYLAYSLREQLNNLDNNMATTMCNSKYQGHDDTPVHMYGNTFGLIKGDLLLKFDCESRVSKIKEAENCYTDIPLVSGGFVSPLSKQWVNHSTHTPCSAHFPMTIKANEAWIEVTPLLKVRAAPLELDSEVSKMNFTDYSHGGLYTSSELAEWMHTLTFPKYEKATLKSLAYGFCSSSGNCRPAEEDGIQEYSLSRLLPELEAEMDLWGRFRAAIREYGDLAAFACLALFAVKFLSDIVMIGMTLLQLGPRAAAIFIMRLYFYNKRQYDKTKEQEIRDKKRKEIRRSSGDGKTEPLLMQEVPQTISSAPTLQMPTMPIYGPGGDMQMPIVRLATGIQ